MRLSPKPPYFFRAGWHEGASSRRTANGTAGWVAVRQQVEQAVWPAVLALALAGISVAVMANPAKAFEAIPWQGLLRTGVEADAGYVLPSISLSLDGEVRGTKAGLTLSKSGFSEDAAKRRESFQATISREIEKWLFKVEGYSRKTGSDESDEDGQVSGVDVTARDISLGQRPAVLEGGVKLRERALPGRPESEYREAGYVFQTGFRLNDAPSILLREFDPLWMSGLSGWIHDALSEEEDLSLPEWFVEEEFSRLRPQWPGLLDAGLGLDGPEPPKRTYTATVQREYLDRDYTVGQAKDSEYSQNTVSFSEQSGDIRASLEHVTTQRRYPAGSGDEYLLQQVSLRTTRTRKSGSVGETRGDAPPRGRAAVTSWELQAGMDEKEYPANADQDYRQWRGQIARSVVWAGELTRELSWAAGARWRERSDGIGQVRVTCELGGSSKSGSYKGDWKAVYSEWRGQEGEGAEVDRRSVRLRLGGRLPLSDAVSGSASIAQEWKSELDPGLGWQSWQPETVGELKVEVAF